MAEGKPSTFHLAFYLVAILLGGRYGWVIGNNLWGIEWGIIFAVIGSALCSTLVGVIAVNIFGFKAKYLDFNSHVHSWIRTIIVFPSNVISIFYYYFKTIHNKKVRTSNPDKDAELNNYDDDNVKTIKAALIKRVEAGLDAPLFESELKRSLSKDDSREFCRVGYMLRMAEKDVSEFKKLNPTQTVLGIISQSNTSEDKIKALADYFENHSRMGLGEPIWPYLYAPYMDIATVFDNVTWSLLPKDSNDIDFEIAARMVSFGYGYRVAEEIITNYLTDGNLHTKVRWYPLPTHHGIHYDLDIDEVSKVRYIFEDNLHMQRPLSKNEVHVITHYLEEFKKFGFPTINKTLPSPFVIIVPVITFKLVITGEKLALETEWNNSDEENYSETYITIREFTNYIENLLDIDFSVLEMPLYL